jgi:hypothetical protein
LSTKTPTAASIKPHRGQETILKGRARFTVVACGRRFGKTELGKIAILETALRGGRCWWLSPTYRMAGQVWRDLRRACRRLDGVAIDATDRQIELAGGGLIAIRSAHQPDHLRGAGLDFVVLDEAAFMAPEVWPEIIRPMLVERQGGALFLSTPYGRNAFWRLYLLGLDPEQPDWRSFHFTSYDNPLIPPGEIDALRATTPEHVFRAEYLAEFIDDAGQVFRGVREAATAPPLAAAAPEAGRTYIGGIDWGRSRDYTVITLIDAEAGRVVAIDRFNQIGWALQRGRLAALCARWSPAALWAEENSMGAVNIEALAAEGLPMRPFKMTAASKPPLIEALALAIERGQLALPPDETLLAELSAYEMQRLPGGGHRYSAPAGGHDDMVISLALAWHGARAGRAAMIDFV